MTVSVDVSGAFPLIAFLSRCMHGLPGSPSGMGGSERVDTCAKSHSSASVPEPICTSLPSLVSAG